MNPEVSKVVEHATGYSQVAVDALAESNSRLRVAMEVRASRDGEPELFRKSLIPLHVRFRVVGVINLQAPKPVIAKLSDEFCLTFVIADAKTNLICNDTQTTGPFDLFDQIGRAS